MGLAEQHPVLAFLLLLLATLAWCGLVAWLDGHGERGRTQSDFDTLHARVNRDREEYFI